MAKKLKVYFLDGLVKDDQFDGDIEELNWQES